MIGKKIRELRRLKETTQKELGNFLGYSEAQICHIENGNRKISIDNLEKLTKFFNVSYEYFFSKKKEEKKEEKKETYDLLISNFKKFAIKEIKKNKKIKLIK